MLRQFPATAPTAQASSQGTATTVAPPAGGYTAREMYEAAQMHRRTLRDQLSSAENTRDEIAQELRGPMVTGADRAGLEQRLKVVDIKVLDLEQQLADAQRTEALAASVPGADRPTPRDQYEDRTEMMLTVGLLLTFVVVLPLVLVQARRLWKKHSVVLSMTPELDQRLAGIDRAVEATAIEIERIGEGQRFVTQLLSSRGEQLRIDARGSSQTE